MTTLRRKLHIKTFQSGYMVQVFFGTSPLDWVMVNRKDIEKAGSLANCLRDKSNLSEASKEKNLAAGRSFLARGAERAARNYQYAWLVLNTPDIPQEEA